MKNLYLPVTLALMLLASACGALSNTEAGEIGCVFNGGPFDNKEFREYTPPGNGRERVGVESKVVEVPLRLITYEVSLDETRGDTPTSDSLDVNVGGMLMQFEPTIQSKFNTALINDDDDPDKPMVCELIEIHLNPFDATDFNTPGGQWQYTWLKDRYRPWIDTAGVRALQAFPDPIAMYFNYPSDIEAPAGYDGVWPVGYRDQAAVHIGIEFSAELSAALGDDYFCGPDHSFLSDECEVMRVSLPQPVVSAEDESILKAPQRARTQANANIASAKEDAREAEEVAEARTDQAQFAKEKADADEEIAKQEARTLEVTVAQEYEWCRFLLQELGQDCWLIKAAENNGLPLVMGDIPEGVQITVPAEAPGGGQ